jgi:carboxylesterase
MPRIIPTAEPFFLPGRGKYARIGCLVTHGFTSSPKVVRYVGECFNAVGFTVLGERLTGHATRPEDMIRSRWQDWMLSLEDGYNLLRSQTDQVFLLGLSMGGALSLVAASRLPSAFGPDGRGVRGVVTMSTPYALPNDRLLRYLNLLSLVRPYLPKSKEAPGAGWFDKDSWRQHVAYPENPVRAISELAQLLRVMRGALPQVRVPALLIHSRDDHYVLDGSMESIFEHLGSADKQEIWVEGGGHNITIEPTRDVVFQRSYEFILRVLSQ